jgi:hypothetical protein
MRAVYVTRVEWLCNVGQMFATRQEAEAYVESGAIRGLWEFDPVSCDEETAKCRWIPAGRFDDVTFVQIVHPK